MQVIDLMTDTINGRLLDFLATPVLAVALFWLARTDHYVGRLPDAITLPLIGLGIGLAAVRQNGFPMAEVIGAVAGFAVFWAFGAAYFRLRGQDGLGLGDAKLLAAAGAWLGWAALPVLVLAATLGALGFALVTRRQARDPVAFGPWLALAFGALWLVGLSGVSVGEMYAGS